jgi:hypothetical protein
MMDNLKRPDLSDWPEWLRDGPVIGIVRHVTNGKTSEASIIGYIPDSACPFMYVTENGVVFQSNHAEPLYQWQPSLDEPVLWWIRKDPDSNAPRIHSYAHVSAFDKRIIRVCKSVIVNPWTVGECRRRLAAGELEEYNP